MKHQNNKNTFVANFFFKFFPLLFITSILLNSCNNRGKLPENANKENTNLGKNSRVTLSKESARLINLETAPVKIEKITGELTIPATVEPNQDLEAEVGSLIQGRVQKLFVKIGDFVKSGQVLMTLEGLDIGTIKADYLKAKASLDFTKSAYERQKKLYDNQIGSQKTLLETQSEYQKALAEFNAEDKKIHSIGLTDKDVLNEQNNLDHSSGTLQIKSPISGFIVERNIVLGQLIDANTNAFKIVNTNSVWIDGQAYEKDLNKISKKTSAIFTTSVYPTEKFHGNIIYIGQAIDEKSRTLLIRGEFTNIQNKLKPQMFGDLKIPIGDNSFSLTVPEESVVKEDGTNYVFVQINDTTFEQRNVLIGTNFKDKIEIKEGLKEGDIIVSKGVFYLKSELKKEDLEGD